MSYTFELSVGCGTSKSDTTETKTHHHQVGSDVIDWHRSFSCFHIVEGSHFPVLT